MNNPFQQPVQPGNFGQLPTFSGGSIGDQPSRRPVPSQFSGGSIGDGPVSPFTPQQPQFGGGPVNPGLPGPTTPIQPGLQPGLARPGQPGPVGSPVRRNRLAPQQQAGAFGQQFGGAGQFQGAGVQQNPMAQQQQAPNAMMLQLLRMYGLI